MEKSFDDNQLNNVQYCPRCNEMIKKGEHICIKCGFDFSTIDQQEEKAVLNFGLEEENEIVITPTDKKGLYRQIETKPIKICKIIYTAFLYVVSIVSLMMLFMPMFTEHNFFNSALFMKKQGYDISLFDFWKLDSSTSFSDLINSLDLYVQSKNVEFNTSMIMFYYELFVLIIVSIMILSGLALLLIAIRQTITGKKSQHDRRLIGLNLALSMILIFALNVSGVGPIVVAVLSTLSLIFFYISGVLSKEKRFFLKQLIHKSICIVVLFALLVLSCVGLVNLNVDLGVNLFTFAEYPKDGALLLTHEFDCRGFFYEYMQFVQSTSGDDVFTSVTFSFNVLTLISHIIYVFFIVFAIVDILKSLSKQSIRFPVHSIVIATVGFYAFATFALIFNQVVNEAMYQKFVENMGNGSFGSFDQSQIETYRKLNSIFTIKFGMMISMILNLPACIYAVIARRICLRRTY